MKLDRNSNLDCRYLSLPARTSDHPLVLVEREDSYRPAPGWMHLSEFEPRAPSKCVGLAWLIQDGDPLRRSPRLAGLTTTIRKRAR